jgi:Ca-activated chloride channel family protein
VDDWLLTDQRGQHERESVPLIVPDEYADRFDQLREYLAAEKIAVDEDSLEQEVELLDTLCQGVESSAEVAE